MPCRYAYVSSAYLLRTVHLTYIELLSGISVECPIIVEDTDELQMMAPPNFVIVGVMSRRDLYRTRPEILVNHFIRNDR